MVEESDREEKLKLEQLELDKLPYKWKQTLQEVDLTIQLPKGTRGRDLQVTITKAHLSVTIKGQEPLVKGELCAPIKEEESTWLIDNNELLIHLEKINKQEWWKNVVTHHFAIDTTLIQPENSKLSELDGETRGMVEKMMLWDCYSPIIEKKVTYIDGAFNDLGDISIDEIDLYIAIFRKQGGRYYRFGSPHMINLQKLTKWIEEAPNDPISITIYKYSSNLKNTTMLGNYHSWKASSVGLPITNRAGGYRIKSLNQMVRILKNTHTDLASEELHWSRWAKAILESPNLSMESRMELANRPPNYFGSELSDHFFPNIPETRQQRKEGIIMARVTGYKRILLEMERLDQKVVHDHENLQIELKKTTEALQAIQGSLEVMANNLKNKQDQTRSMIGRIIERAEIAIETITDYARIDLTIVGDIDIPDVVPQEDINHD
ncbi:hypothetical protein HDV01_007306 [Terramyces sp. JEL0728]|nr:hypothetical protein HDV01_007306 [Terramyces sp. JEL0728]